MGCERGWSRRSNTHRFRRKTRPGTGIYVRMGDSMKIFMTGGTGFVGAYFAERFAQTGHEVVIVTRSAATRRSFPGGTTLVEGNPMAPGRWQERVAGCDAVINLAGESIFNRWSPEMRQSILDSRVLTTRRVVEALADSGGKSTLISASAVGYYGSNTGDALVDETSPSGDGFLVRVAKEWEREATEAEHFGARVVLCRFGVVFGGGGGALVKMAPPFRYGLGSAIGDGRQWFPWIHQEDLFNIMLFLLEHGEIDGPLNCTAPYPVRNEELTRELANALNRPLIAPHIPAFLVKTLLGEFGDVFLKGQRAVPRRLMEKGFHFRFPTIQEAMGDLLSRMGAAA